MESRLSVSPQEARHNSRQLIEFMPYLANLKDKYRDSRGVQQDIPIKRPYSQRSLHSLVQCSRVFTLTDDSDSVSLKLCGKLVGAWAGGREGGILIKEEDLLPSESPYFLYLRETALSAPFPALWPI